jgi:Cu+-exporting ATPase
MLRRHFLRLVTAAGVAGAVPAGVLAATAHRTAVYTVKGFSCITCATGLDTMLGRQPGILSSKSTYPQGEVTVSYDPETTNEQAIIAFIGELGFIVEGKHEN